MALSVVRLLERTRMGCLRESSGFSARSVILASASFVKHRLTSQACLVKLARPSTPPEGPPHGHPDLPALHRHRAVPRRGRKGSHTRLRPGGEVVFGDS